MQVERTRKQLPYMPGLIAYGVIYALGSVGVLLGLHSRG